MRSSVLTLFTTLMLDIICFFQLELSPRESKAYAKWLDEWNANRDLDDQEVKATERFLRRYVVRERSCFALVQFSSVLLG